jgi:hypothetical protein
MWETAISSITSIHPLVALFFTVIGYILKPVVGALINLRAKRPRLIVSGQGGGGGRWNVTVSNRPTILGQNFDGESARDVHAWISRKERGWRRSQPWQAYPVFFQGSEKGAPVTINPGEKWALELFHKLDGIPGYVILDHAGTPAARFDERDNWFVLRIADRLNRRTEFTFSVRFDPNHIRSDQALQIVLQTTMQDRIRRFRDGVRQIMSAFRL